MLLIWLSKDEPQNVKRRADGCWRDRARQSGRARRPLRGLLRLEARQAASRRDRCGPLELTLTQVDLAIGPDVSSRLQRTWSFRRPRNSAIGTE